MSTRPFSATLPISIFRNAVADLRDVGARILAELARQENRPLLDVSEPVILTAPEILPSQAMNFDRKLVAGILTERGAATGHAAILARSLNIPAVSGLDGLTRQVKTGDLIALDGREGHVHINPGPEVVAAYRKLQREYVDLVGRLVGNCGSAGRVEVTASPWNCWPTSTASTTRPMAARSVCAAGVGLYRTEYLFLTHPSVPDEEEQFQTYRSVIESAPNRTVTIRTIDLGADKSVPYFGREGEANPFMGFRSIRLSYAYPEFFRTQLRAILRAGLEGKVELLFPMVSTLEEVRDIRRMVEDDAGGIAPIGSAFRGRRAAGRDDRGAGRGAVHRGDRPRGGFREHRVERPDPVPDGGRPRQPQGGAPVRAVQPGAVAAAEPRHPDVRRPRQTGDAVRRDGGPARCVLPLFGMGLRRMSMSPAFVPSIREMVRHATLAAAKEAAQAVLHMATVGEVRSYLTAKVREIWPDMRLLDMRE